MKIDATLTNDDRLVVTIVGVPLTLRHAGGVAAAAQAFAEWAAWELMPEAQRKEWAREVSGQLAELADAPPAATEPLAEVIPLGPPGVDAALAGGRHFTHPAPTELAPEFIEPPVVDVVAERPPSSAAVVGDVDGRAHLTVLDGAGEPDGGGRGPGSGHEVPAAAAGDETGQGSAAEGSEPTPPAPSTATDVDPDRAAALELLAAGLGPRAVADELDIPLSRVRAWKKEM